MDKKKTATTKLGMAEAWMGWEGKVLEGAEYLSIEFGQGSFRTVDAVKAKDASDSGYESGCAIPVAVTPRRSVAVHSFRK